MSVALLAYALCSVQDVKSRLDANMAPETDDVLARMINALSAYAQEHTGRLFQNTQYTEYFDCYVAGGSNGPTQSIQLRALPIDTAADFLVYNDPLRSFGSTTALVANTDYVLNTKLGRITKISSQIFDIGFSSSPRPARYPVGFDGGPQALKVVYTGGFITPRAAAPTTPTAATNSTGVLTGVYRWRMATKTNATGVETIASESVVLSTSANAARLSFANPGATKTSVFYRTKAGSNAFYYVGTVAGDAGGAQTFDDNNADAVLDTTRSAPEAGPLTYADGLDQIREAAVKQIVHEWKVRNDPGVTAQTSTGQGSVTYRIKGMLLPYTEEVFDSLLQVAA